MNGRDLVLDGRGSVSIGNPITPYSTLWKYWNNTLWLVKNSHVTWNIQWESYISAYYSYATNYAPDPKVHFIYI